MEKIASQFNFTYRYIDDVLSINSPDFQNFLGQMYPAELEIIETTDSNISTSYLDFLLPIEIDGQLRTSLCDKHDDFTFHITNFPFLSSNIQSSPVYGVLSQSTYGMPGRAPPMNKGGATFILAPWTGICQEVLWLIWGSHQQLWSFPLPNVIWHSRTWPYRMTSSIDQTLHQFANGLPNWTLLLILTLLPNLYILVEVSFLYFNYLVSVTAGGPESPRGHM